VFDKHNARVAHRLFVVGLLALGLMGTMSTQRNAQTKKEATT